MNLKATILSLLVALACVSSCAAQEKKKETPTRPDFSGTWLLDLKKSKYDGMHSTAAPLYQDKLVITHGEPELKVTRTYTALDGVERTDNFVYYTDGRGEKNAFVSRDRLRYSSEIESETKWKGARLVTRGVEYMKAFGDVTDANFTEKWELSADGQTLTRTTEYDVLRGVPGAPGDPLPSDASRPRRREGDSVRLTPADSRLVYYRTP